MVSNVRRDQCVTRKAVAAEALTGEGTNESLGTSN